VFKKKITMDEDKLDKLKEAIQIIVAILTAIIVALEKYQEGAGK